MINYCVQVISVRSRCCLFPIGPMLYFAHCNSLPLEGSDLYVIRITFCLLPNLGPPRLLHYSVQYVEAANFFGNAGSGHTGVGRPPTFATPAREIAVSASRNIWRANIRSPIWRSFPGSGCTAARARTWPSTAISRAGSTRSRRARRSQAIWRR